MVHEDHGRPIGRLLEARREPTQSLGAQQAADLAGHERVERDEPHRVALDDVLHEPATARQVRVIGEHGRERVAIVVVARNEVDRHRQRREQIAQPAVLLRPSAIDEVTGRQHEIGARPERQKVAHGARQIGRRVDAPVGENALGLDVHVGDLRHQHGREYGLPFGRGPRRPR